MDTVTIDVPNSRAIAKQLLTLARDPENQPFIVQEQGCLAGLVQYTQHEDIEVVLIATRALQFLSSHPLNKDSMREFPDLVNNLTSSLPRAEEHPRIKEFVFATLENLSVQFRRDISFDERRESLENSDSLLTSFSRRASLGLGLNLASPEVKQTKKLGVFRAVSLFVEGIGQNQLRELAESKLIQIDGVISVTVNPEKQHVVVGTREEEEEAFVKLLLSTLAEEGMPAKLVVPSASKRSESNQYAFLEGTENEEDYPEYLEEDDYDDEDAENGARITRQGFSSLEARLEQQRKDEEAKKLEKSSRLIGKMNSFLSNASNWLMGY